MISDKQLDDLIARTNPILTVPKVTADKKLSICESILASARNPELMPDDHIRLHRSVRLSVENRIGILDIDDGKANVLTMDVIHAINQALQICELDSEITVIAIIGRPEILSAGLDRNLFFGDDGRVSETLNALGHLIIRLYGSKLRIVTACTGHAIAAGALLLLASDLRIGKSGSFQIGMNEAAIGVTLPDWALALAKHRLTKQANQLTLSTGQLYQVVDAINAGFLDKVTNENIRQVALDEADLLSALDLEVYREAALSARKKCLAEMKQHIALSQSENHD
ncbi:MAG: enoyl-CoA hydratase-related protein [Pseudomonadota bacterium]